MITELVYGFDIETDTTTDGLDPNVSSVVAAAVVSARERLVFVGDEATLLLDLDAALAEMAPGVLVTWNGLRFDLPFIALRARMRRLDLGLRLDPEPLEWRRDDEARGSAAPRTSRRVRWGPPSPAASWGAHRHLDAYRLYRGDVGQTLGLSCALKPLSRFLGYEPVEVDRSRIDLLTPTELDAYVSSDAELARELALRRPAALAGWCQRNTKIEW